MKLSIIKYFLPLAALLLCTPVTAQTPDGAVPANEGVCDVLRADGVTKGLYGLCVAYCEAQDHSSLTEPITPEDLDDILMSSPAGRILKNYNAKKTSTDPEMPCMNVVAPCPCAIEGHFDDYGTGTYNGTLCYDRLDDPPTWSHTTARLDTWGSYPHYSAAILVLHSHGESFVRKYGEYWCTAKRYRSVPPPAEFIQFAKHFLTFEEFEACRTFHSETVQALGIACDDW